MGRLTWGLLGLALAIYLVMVLWSMPYIVAEAGGLMPFDMRPTGYDTEAALVFLGAISDAGRAFYLDTQHVLDLFYPGLMGAALFLAIVQLYAHKGAVLRYGLAVSALIGAGFDYLENARVAAMLRAVVSDVEAAEIAAASQATVLKSGFDTVAMVAALAGVVLYWLRKRREKRA